MTTLCSSEDLFYRIKAQQSYGDATYDIVFLQNMRYLSMDVKHIIKFYHDKERTSPGFNRTDILLDNWRVCLITNYSDETVF